MIQFLSNPFTLAVLFVAALIIGGAWRLHRDKTQRQQNADDQQPGMQLNSAVVAVVLAVVWVLALFQLPSLSIDINGIFTYAFDVVNAFMPLIAIIAGLGLGFNLITKISGLFNRAL